MRLAVLARQVAQLFRPGAGAAPQTPHSPAARRAWYSALVCRAVYVRCSAHSVQPGSAVIRHRVHVPWAFWRE